MTDQPCSAYAEPLLRWMLVAGIVDKYLCVPGLTRLVAGYVFRVPPPYLAAAPPSQEPVWQSVS